ncbi:TetR/AcrR family transcriptional regulator [Paractinoplanes ferrugineus]|uniref:TetR family transcriptional regulator n=1 Tax=Paractinoplanes ferrugineus TaxID=113564 RepID=A0A919MJU5_9ACTN|nr:TetR family transcriptional regulator [Actinoplanes ferrugineus]
MDARERLERAAVELFVAKGFAATTVPEITARAGLTTRTFHRHFADKREVLFAGGEFAELATRMIADAPADWKPMRVVVEGVVTVAATRFDGRREELLVRRGIIRSDAGLGERELQKWADLGRAGTAGFRARGIEPMRAALLAETAMTLLRVAAEQWLDHDTDRSLAEMVREAAAALRDEVSAR